MCVSKVQAVRKKKDGLDYNIIRDFCSVKDTLEQVHRQMKNREKVFAMFEMDKGPILKLSQGIPTKHGEIGTARGNGVRETKRQFVEEETPKGYQANEEVSPAQQHTEKCKLKQQ